MCNDTDAVLLARRFLLVGVAGSSFAVFGVISNALFTLLFLTRSAYRHSPFFFLGFVALFDTLLDATFLLLLSLPITAEYADSLYLHSVWLHHVPALYLFAHIFKMTSVFCLIVASIERYCMTRHWTFTGFAYRTRWIMLVIAIMTALFIKSLTSELVIVERPQCTRFGRYVVGTRRDAHANSFINTLSIFAPFLTLVALNGGIVLMLRKQNVQQLRSLITELTMGHDVMKIRRRRVGHFNTCHTTSHTAPFTNLLSDIHHSRVYMNRNLRAATNTLLVIITAYLISNLLNLVLTMAEFLHTDMLHSAHPRLYRIASDFASVLTVFGNAIRGPAHFISNREIRQQLKLMIMGEEKEVEEEKAEVAVQRRRSERVESPWISLLLTVHDHEKPVSPLLAHHNRAKRHSSIAIC